MSAVEAPPSPYKGLAAFEDAAVGRDVTKPAAVSA